MISIIKLMANYKYRQCGYYGRNCLSPDFSFVSLSYQIICVTSVCFRLLMKGSIILHLCGSKIAWNNYAPLQMISEYFPARGRSLNLVKKPSSFMEFEQPYWI